MRCCTRCTVLGWSSSWIQTPEYSYSSAEDSDKEEKEGIQLSGLTEDASNREMSRSNSFM